MKKIQVPSKLLLVISVLLGLATFVFDYLKFESSLSFTQWQYIHEVLTVVIILFFNAFVINTPFLTQTKLSIILKNFIKLLTGLYLWVLVFKFLLAPSYSSAFPPLPDTLSSLFFSNLTSISSILFLVPMILLVKNLIYFKQRSRTKIYTTLALLSTLLTMALSVIFQLPLDFQFAGDGLYVSISLIVTIFLYMLLGTNNSWITYLSRKEKYTYFLVSLVLVWVISLLYDFAFFRFGSST